MNLITSDIYPTMSKLMTSWIYGGEGEGNFEFPDKKVGLVSYHFVLVCSKTMILIEVHLSVMIIKTDEEYA